MKPNKGFRAQHNAPNHDDSTRKAIKLAPNKKSGKERHVLFSSIDGDEIEDDPIAEYKKRESVLDYFDDMEENEELTEEELTDGIEDDWEEYREAEGDQADLE